MKKLFAVLAALILLAMTSCGSGGGGSSSGGLNDTDTVSANIGPSGRELETPSGDAGLNVPTGALSNETSITVSKSNKSTPPGSIAVSYDYTPDGQTFTSPVTICIKYDPDSIPEGMSPSDLRLARLSDNGEWEIIGASTVDITNQLVCGQTSHFSTYTVVIHERKSFGEQTGDFNTVIAYSNGTTENVSDEYNTYNSYNTGMKWLCDEYVNRYYKQVYDQEIRIEGRKANDYYQKAAERGLVAYPNDGTEQPQVGDILVSEYGDGHIAIVREVQDNKIFVIQQNWSDNGADDRYPIAREGNHVYSFDGKKGNYEVKGWLRINDTSTSTTSTSTTTNTSTSTTTTTSTSTSSSSSTIITTTTTSTTTTTIAMTYSISGALSGDVISGVTITLSGTGSTSTTTDSSGNYSFSGAANGSYILQPSQMKGSTLLCVNYNPLSRGITVNNANITGQNFTSTFYAYNISGTVSGDVVSGIGVTMCNNESLDECYKTYTDDSGNYFMSCVPNGNYQIGTDVGLRTTIIINNTDITEYNFIYSISGTVTLNGVGLEGVYVAISGEYSSVQLLTTDSSGNYSLRGVTNGNYTIMPMKTGYTFSPTNINATVNNTDATGQNFTATAN